MNYFTTKLNGVTMFPGANSQEQRKSLVIEVLVLIRLHPAKSWKIFEMFCDESNHHANGYAARRNVRRKFSLVGGRWNHGYFFVPVVNVSLAAISITVSSASRTATEGIQ